MDRTVHISAEDLSWRALLRGRRGLYCLILTAGLILYAVISPISYTILPAIIKELNADIYYSWVAMLFALGSLLGACALTHSLRLMRAHIAYITALLLFALCTLGCAYAPSLAFLLGARALQGFGGGLLVALTYSMLNTALPPHLLPRGIGLISGMWGIATLIGPYLGGSFANWRVPFFAVSAAALLFCFVVFFIFRTLPRGETEAQKLPPAAPLPAIALLTALVLTVSLGGALPALLPGLNQLFAALGLSLQFAVSPLAGGIGGLILGAGLLLLLGFIEKHSKNKLLPAGSFRPGSIFFLIYAIIILNMVALGGTKLYLPLFLQELHKAGPITAGYITFADSIGWTIGALIGAGLNTNAQKRAKFLTHSAPQSGEKQAFYKSSRFGQNMAFIFAPIACTVSMGLAFWLVPAAVAASSVLLLIGLAFFIVGFFSGIFWPHILARIMQNAKPEEKEAADSSLCIVQFFAPALADCLAGTLVNATGFKADNIVSLSYAAQILFGFCLILLAIVCLLCLKVKRLSNKTAPQS